MGTLDLTIYCHWAVFKSKVLVEGHVFLMANNRLVFLLPLTLMLSTTIVVIVNQRLYR